MADTVDEVVAVELDEEPNSSAFKLGATGGVREASSAPLPWHTLTRSGRRTELLRCGLRRDSVTHTRDHRRAQVREIRQLLGIRLRPLPLGQVRAAPQAGTPLRASASP